jgi:hypothetical protein
MMAVCTGQSSNAKTRVSHHGNSFPLEEDKKKFIQVRFLTTAMTELQQATVLESSCNFVPFNSASAAL